MSIINHYRSSKRKILKHDTTRGFYRWLKKEVAKGYTEPRILALMAVEAGLANSPQQAWALIMAAAKKFD